MAPQRQNKINANDTGVTQALQSMTAPFSKAELVTALSSSLGVTVTSDEARQLLQTLKRQSVIVHDPITRKWSTVTAPSQTAAAVTLPLLPSNQPASFSSPRAAQGQTSSGFLASLQSLLHGSVAHLACLAAILALVAINASFAWNLGETDGFRYPLVIGLMACDLIRPLLIARGLSDFARWRVIRGSLAFTIALSLAPLSILSSTSVISASLFLGVEQNQKAEVSDSVRSNLQQEYQRLQGAIEQQWRDWEEECKRGGCGAKAARLAAIAKATEEESKQRLSEIVELAETNSATSQFIARTVKAFEALGLFGADKRMLIPLLLALTLEIAALFGPGLLLARRM